MSAKKREREVRMIAERAIAKYRDIEIEGIRVAKHMCITITRNGGEARKKIFLSSTPSCSRWAVHLKKDIRRAIIEFEDLYEVA